MFMLRPMRLMALVLLLGGGGYYTFFAGYAIVNAPPKAGPIVAFGDSLTQSVGATTGNTYPEQPAHLAGRPVVNAGVGGNTIGDAAARLERDVLSRRPGIVIVMLGGNDLLQRKNLDESFPVLEKMVKSIQGQGAMVVLVGLRFISPIGGLEGRYARLARRTGCVFVSNIMGGILLDHALMSDQIHPNDQGYKIISERIFKALKPYL